MSKHQMIRQSRVRSVHRSVQTKLTGDTLSQSFAGMSITHQTPPTLGPDLVRCSVSVRTVLIMGNIGLLVIFYLSVCVPMTSTRLQCVSCDQNLYITSVSDQVFVSIPPFTSSLKNFFHCWTIDSLYTCYGYFLVGTVSSTVLSSMVFSWFLTVNQRCYEFTEFLSDHFQSRWVGGRNGSSPPPSIHPPKDFVKTKKVIWRQGLKDLMW